MIFFLIVENKSSFYFLGTYFKVSDIKGAL